MAKFIINKHTAAPRTVEATKYELTAGYFWFTDSSVGDVATYKAETVASIHRVDEGK